MARLYTKEELEAAVARVTTKHAAYFAKIGGAAVRIEELLAGVDLGKNRQKFAGEIALILRTVDRAGR